MKHLLLASLLLFTACSTDGNTQYIKPYPVVISEGSCIPLLAGQTMEAGSVCATIEGENIKVTYQVSGDWLLSETHLWVDTSLTTLPVTRAGNPKIGLFPYTSGSLDGATSYEFLVPLSLFGLSGDEEVCDPVTLFAVAHAALYRVLEDGTVQTETGFADGTRLVDRGSWATYFTWNLTCEEDPVGPGPGGLSCETAFAMGNEATCFIGEPYGFHRWGWTNGPLGIGSYEFEIYAGAGQCDLSKGELVGTLFVEYDGSMATIQYTTFPMFFMEETHLYIGNEPLARNGLGEYTVAPGQYPYQHDLTLDTMDEYVVTGLSGDIYIVAHAVTCQEQIMEEGL